MTWESFHIKYSNTRKYIYLRPIKFQYQGVLQKKKIFLIAMIHNLHTQTETFG